MKRSSLSISFLTFCLVFTGCGALGFSGSSFNSQTVLTDPESGEAPVDVKIKSASREGDLLLLDVNVTPQTSIRTDRLAVAMIGLSEGGEVVRREVALVKDLVQKNTLAAGEEVQVNFVVEAAGISDYEIKCSWGAQAVALVKNNKSVPTPKIKDASGMIEKLAQSEPELVQVATASNDATSRGRLKTGMIQEEIADLMESTAHEEEDLIEGERNKSLVSLDSSNTIEEAPLPVETVKTVQKQSALSQTGKAGKVLITGLKKVKTLSKCGAPPCDYYYALDAVVENQSSRPVKNVQFGIGIFWQGDQAKAEVPIDGAPVGENEEVLEQNNIDLSPGESRRINVELDQAIPVVPGGAFVPNIRILGHS